MHGASTAAQRHYDVETTHLPTDYRLTELSNEMSPDVTASGPGQVDSGSGGERFPEPRDL